MKPPPGYASSKRELNQFSGYPVNFPVDSKKAPAFVFLGGALLSFLAISVIYSACLLGVLGILRDAGALSWSLSFLESLALSALVVLVRTIERALGAVSRKGGDDKSVNLNVRSGRSR